MASPKGSSRPYAVHCSAQVAEALKALVREALRVGNGGGVMSAARAIDRYLRTSPTTFGEPLFRLPALNLQVRVGVVYPLVVDYAVHEVEPIVFIRGVALLSGG